MDSFIYISHTNAAMFAMFITRGFMIGIITGIISGIISAIGCVIGNYIKSKA